MKKILSLLILVAATFLNGCGYTTSSTLPGHLKTIYIDRLANEISYTSSTSREVYFPLLEVDARNAIIDRFQFDGNLTLTDTDRADLVLKGKLIEYERQGLRFTDNDTIQEYRVNVVVALELWDMTKGEIKWAEPRFVGQATYFLSGPEATTEESAVQEALKDLARRIVERTVEDW